MVWKEIKEQIEAAGVKDQDVICWIRVGGLPIEVVRFPDDTVAID